MDELSIEKNDYILRGPEDDLRVDQLCRQLLRRFYDQMISDGKDPGEATAWASGADLYLRDFIVDRKRGSIFDETPGVVRQFAGNWYIVSTLEPNMEELTPILRGIHAFYRFLAGHGLISSTFLAGIEEECDALEFYRQRIETFWQISGDGYGAWDRECSMKP